MPLCPSSLPYSSALPYCYAMSLPEPGPPVDMSSLNSFGNCIGQHSECVSRPMGPCLCLLCYPIALSSLSFSSVLGKSLVFLVCHQEVIDAQLGGEVNMVFEISQTDSGDT